MKTAQIYLNNPKQAGTARIDALAVNIDLKVGDADEPQGTFSPTVNKSLNPELRKYLSKRSKNGFLSPTAASSRKTLAQQEEDMNYEAILNDTDEQSLRNRARSGER